MLLSRGSCVNAQSFLSTMAECSPGLSGDDRPNSLTSRAAAGHDTVTIEEPPNRRVMEPERGVGGCRLLARRVPRNDAHRRLLLGRRPGFGGGGSRLRAAVVVIAAVKARGTDDERRP